MLSQDFYDQLEVSVPGQEYLSLVSLRRSQALVPEKGFEIHHIQPTSLGGLNVSENKVKLSVFEHCKAHALLAKAIPCYKTLQPLVRMSSGQIKKLSDVDLAVLENFYEWSKLREKALHHPKSDEQKNKNRKGHLGKKLSSEHIKKRTAKRKGTVTVTDGKVTKYIQKKDLLEYERLGWYRGISESRREKLQSSHKNKVGSTKGRICINNGEKELKVKKEDLEKYLSKGWQRGRRRAKK